ncbi:ABC transporter ATP-binding protein [Tetragenococcus koreensis]|uniref:ABC transporter ATP-binding protein n=1 Tax=Tetragenococcus koreensis TaxID=290335 RepID=UPI001F27BEB2|nr:ABC transporter ATP-binding protein [Tetragenococcus koreensis]MCF1617572.1 ABC transporter ATP-binding protein/permease [Tetragenococcus koreensis]MCF1622356.1 ABC transporter ATP-binding protein/permease [Tetragenococcus koreensis]MCF1627673.1 ABC transporter ATP-binding protein/permease [Tetragenococcus koreensis]MCF1632595.1 ABC transporter ATP-binding protein/permease [Tetragenococcus koreensis]MCF1678504.1 ABC transporter ATP-binding protein/permease [Tetragenococcus koreensis]
MIKVIKKISFTSALIAVGFMVFQVISDLYLPNMTSNIIDNGVAEGDIGYIWRIGGIMMIISLISIIAAFGNAFFATRESQRLGRKLRTSIYQKVENFSIDKFDKYGTASLITRTTNDVNQIQMVVQMFLRLMIQAPIMLIGASFLAYQKDAQLTKVFFVVIPLAIVAIGGIMYFAVPLFRSMQKKTDHLNLVFREELTGVRVIRAFNKTDYETNRFDQANRDFTHTAIKVNTLVALMLPLMTLIMSGTNIGITWFGGQYIADMQLQVGNMIAFITYAMQILISFMMLSMIFVMVPRAQASADRINEILDETDDITDKKQPERISLAKENATLQFDHVNFRYADADKLALEDVHFKAKAGDTVAIIGGTGSGKTTFVNLLPRLHEIESGSIRLNGHDIQNISQHDLRELIGFVPQTAVLFRGTIRENMRYGNAEATEDQIWQALKIAQAQDFVAEMPDGLDSHVEQGGGNFSGGQRQRLAIARALIKEADLYVFDDSFSALDFKTDANLRQALQEEMTDGIMVIVAQRVSTIMDADMILVLEAGQVVGKGTHKELLENNKTYQEIVHSQLREEDLG